MSRIILTLGYIAFLCTVCTAAEEPLTNEPDCVGGVCDIIPAEDDLPPLGVALPDMSGDFYADPATREFWWERRADLKTIGPALPMMELGRVNWIRDYDDAVVLSKESGKPIMLLFQETPGCDVCEWFGCGPLSHTLIVDAAENEFIPCAISNNISGGKDRETLERFEEPASNAPVVRFVDSAGDDLIPRKHAVFSIGELLQRMATALEKADRPVPQYLSLAAYEASIEKVESVSFEVDCYCGKDHLFQPLPGMLYVGMGSVGRSEAIHVIFDPAVISFEELMEHVKEKSIYFQSVYARSDEHQEIAERVNAVPVIRIDDPLLDFRECTDRISLYKEYFYLPMTPLQEARISLELSLGPVRRKPDALLSPAQFELRDAIISLQEVDPSVLTRLDPDDRSPVGMLRYANKFRDAIEEFQQSPSSGIAN